jgi:hypothetical protein
VLFSPMPFGAFQPLKPAPGRPATISPGADINPEFKDLAQAWGWKMIAEHEKMDRDHPVGTAARSCSRASVVEKLRTAWVRKAPSGSFDSAPPSAAPRDKSVRRSAQDDGFVGVLKKDIPNKLALMGLLPGLSSAVPVRQAQGWPYGTRFGDGLLLWSRTMFTKS